MKSTYKLLGSIWDGIDTEDTVALYNYSYDGSSKSSNISFKELLTANTGNDVDLIVKNIINCECILLNVDYWCNNVYLSVFLEKRLKQMIAYIKKRYGVKVYIKYSVQLRIDKVGIE